MTTTAAKKKKTMTFRQLLSKVTKNPSHLKTAAQNGWLLGENFATKLSDREQDVVRKLYHENAEAKKAQAADLGFLPATVGLMVESPKVHGKRVRLAAGEQVLYVDGLLFVTMQKRHPNSHLYLSPDRHHLIFSERSTVAMLPCQQ